MILANKYYLPVCRDVRCGVNPTQVFEMDLPNPKLKNPENLLFNKMISKIQVNRRNIFIGKYALLFKSINKIL